MITRVLESAPHLKTKSPPRFYCREALASGARVELPPPVARHAVRVLRLLVGAAVTLFDGRGGEYSAAITHIEGERAFATLGAWKDIGCESPLHIALLQALQGGEKMDLTIQKAVELGVSHIVPLESKRSIVRLSGDRAGKRVAHWQGVVASACEQCGRNFLPLVAPIEKIDHFLSHPAKERLCRLMLSPEGQVSLHDIPPPKGAVQLLVGAEGGLDAREINLACHVGFIPVRLGPRILRTETAGLTALAVIQTLWGDFSNRQT